MAELSGDVKELVQRWLTWDPNETTRNEIIALVRTISR
jgi:hypothetical protein